MIKYNEMQELIYIKTRTTTPAYERPLQVCVIYDVGEGISRLVGGNEVMGVV